MTADTLIAAGAALLVAGLVLLAAGLALHGDATVEGGAVVFIGPIPVVIGSNEKMAVAAAVLGGILLAAAAGLHLRA